MAHYATLVFFIVVNFFVAQLDTVGATLTFTVRVAESYI